MTETSAHTSFETSNDSYTVQFDRLDDEPLSVTIATAVSAVTGTDVTDLPPLHYSIDADALERLFEPRADGLRSNGRVTFEYNDCHVTVSATGEITVDRPDEA